MKIKEKANKKYLEISAYVILTCVAIYVLSLIEKVIWILKI